MSALARYARERLPLQVFGPALVCLVGLAWWAARPPEPGVVARSAAVVLLLLLQFRLWDDLADLDADRAAHPARVLTRLSLTPSSLTPFHLALALLTLAAAIVSVTRPMALAAVILLDAAFLCAYWRLRRQVRDEVWRFGILLLKYPAFVAIATLAATDALDGLRLVFAAVAAYAGAALYEDWHTRPRTDVKTPDVFRAPSSCLACGSSAHRFFIEGEDDLTGTPGRFTFVRCDDCGLVYQNPRLTLEQIRPYYDSEYIAHQPHERWGLLAPLFRAAMGSLDRAKLRLVQRHQTLSASSHVIDVGCGAGSFLEKVRTDTGASIAGVDLVDLSGRHSLREATFYQGLFYEQPMPEASADLVTMWHFLEHDYDPRRSLAQAHRVLKPGGYLVIEVPRLDSLSFRLFRSRWPGIQAPQHTVLFDKAHLIDLVSRERFDVVEHLAYGAFPPYFYLFCGVAFSLLRGRGLNLQRAIWAYFAGQLLALPLLPFLPHMNFAMQTIVCRRSR